MLNNYRYFIVLAEELNITNAANKLFISHQCLSKYLKNMEDEYGVMFFERKPKLTLTPAGKIMYDALRNIELTEMNLNAQLEDIKNAKIGRIRFGITEGRYAIIIPRLIKAFHDLYPSIELQVHSLTSPEMQEAVMNNDLDLYLAGAGNILSDELEYDVVMEEDLYLVISDNMLRDFFPDTYPECKAQFRAGADLRQFQHVPFVLNHRGFSSRVMLDHHLEKLGITLRCVNELTQPDIHHRLSAEDYAASFCLTMYLPEVQQLNQQNNTSSILNVFPIRGFYERTPLAMIYHKRKIFPSYTRDFIKLVRDECSLYKSYVVPTGM